MARKPEQKLWDRMRTALSKAKIRLERIENVVSEGIPDVLVLAGGWVTFCELKQVAAAPKRPSTGLLPSGKGVRRSQLNWHLEWCRHGGRSLIIIGVGAKQIYCLPGEMADAANLMTEAGMRAFSVASNWAELAEHLKGHR